MPGAVRLSISFSGHAAAIPSLFLADAHNSAAATAGRLRIDRTTGRWTLLDGNSRKIVVGDLGRLLHDAAGRSFVRVTIDKTADESFYGSGGGRGLPPSLLRLQGQGTVAGGWAMVPYYWSTAGYAVFAISQDDLRPASWDGRDGNQVAWDFEGTKCDLYLIPAANLEQACSGLAQLTGFPPVPPRWTFGYLQSQWGWKDAAYIEDARKQFIARRLPVDAFIFDFEWFTSQDDYHVGESGQSGYHDFAWNPILFPDPSAAIARLKRDGIHTVLIRKPRLGSSELLDMARRKGWILRHGTGVDARCLDLANLNCRRWYAQQLIPILRCGVDGWWDDEGEINTTTYWYWNQAEQLAQDAVKPSERAWFLDRSFMPGLGRLGAAAWTADIPADFATLAKTPGDLLNWGLAGMDYGACDIGGYYTNCTPRLLVRWMEAGVFFPVMRSHSQTGVTPRFPWLYGADAEAAIRKALELRYRLEPYLYSLGYEAHERGLPIMRPLVMEFAEDPRVWDLTDQWLVGRGLMAAPVLSESDRRSVYLPDERWFAFETNHLITGGQTLSVNADLEGIPLYVRAGTILPLAPLIQHTCQLPGGPLELEVYRGKDAEFEMVEDDGDSTAYINGDVRRTRFVWNDAERTLRWQSTGPYAGKDVFTEMDAVVFGGSEVERQHVSLSGAGMIRFAK